MQNQTRQQLQLAFNKARLYNQGLTLDEALANKALHIGLKHMVRVALKPPRRHWQD